MQCYTHTYSSARWLHNQIIETHMLISLLKFVPGFDNTFVHPGRKNKLLQKNPPFQICTIRTLDHTTYAKKIVNISILVWNHEPKHWKIASLHNDIHNYITMLKFGLQLIFMIMLFVLYYESTKHVVTLTTRIPSWSTWHPATD